MEYKQYPEMEYFKQKLVDLELELNECQLQQFVDYYEMLIEKNKVMNLTSITEFKEAIDKHFIDSLSLVKVKKLTKEKILDLGTGAGFPGIPLKIVFPDTEIILMDSLNKRLLFLDEVIQKLDFKKVKTVHGRAEDYGKNNLYREQFDLCVSRAVAKLYSLSEFCLPFVKVNGEFIAYKSGNIEEELEHSKKAIKILGAKLDNRESFALPGTDIDRSLVVIKKITATPKNYPRSAGKPLKEPLL